MLEIVLLYFLCKSMGNVLRDKGRKPLGFQILLVIMIGLGCPGLALGLIGVGFGIAGLLQKDRNKLFPGLELALNALVILAICGLMMLGISMG